MSLWWMCHVCMQCVFVNRVLCGIMQLNILPVCKLSISAHSEISTQQILTIARPCKDDDHVIFILLCYVYIFTFISS